MERFSLVICILFNVFIFTAIILGKIGVFQSMGAYEAYEKPFIFYHKQYNMSYNLLKEEFNHNKKIIAFHTHELKEYQPRVVAFYYDKGDNVQAPRSNVGIALSNTSQYIDSMFEVLGYNKSQFNKIKVAQVDLPYLVNSDWISYSLVNIKAYSSLIPILHSRYKDIYQGSLPLIEEVDDRIIKVMLPIGDERSSFSICTLPREDNKYNKKDSSL